MKSMETLLKLKKKKKKKKKEEEKNWSGNQTCSTHLRAEFLQILEIFK